MHVVKSLLWATFAPGYMAEVRWRRELEELSQSAQSDLEGHLAELSGLVTAPVDNPEDVRLARICKLSRYIVVKGAELDAEAGLLRLCRLWHEPPYTWNRELGEKALYLMTKAVERVAGSPYEANCRARLDYLSASLESWCARGRPTREKETPHAGLTTPAV